MNLEQPLAVIADLPHLLGHEPRDLVLVAGFDDAGELVGGNGFPLNTERPLDDAAITVTQWPRSVTSVVVVAYSDDPSVALSTLQQAVISSGRHLVQLLRAGTNTWRSYACGRTRCCPLVGNPYGTSAPGHPPYTPGNPRQPAGNEWRRHLWNTWRVAIDRAADHDFPTGPVRAALASSLFDIPLRDALLAQSARADLPTRAAMRELLIELARHSPLGVALPVHTCTAALLYLDGLTEETAFIVRAVLSIDEYSLARLLKNGLDMRAPSSLLARSFAHFDPLDLLAA